MPSKKALVYLWSGCGWGKTTSALGVALRAVGHGKKVIIIQFLKGWGDKIGEVAIEKRLAPEYEIHQFGTKAWVDLKKPTEKDKALAKAGMAAAFKALKKKPFLLVLDEINLALAVRLVRFQDLTRLLDSAHPSTTIYLTGRSAPQLLKDRADFVTEVIGIKRPKKRVKARPGIEY